MMTSDAVDDWQNYRIFYTRKSITFHNDVHYRVPVLWVHKFSTIAWVRGKNKFIFQSRCCWYQWMGYKRRRKKINLSTLNSHRKKWEENNFLDDKQWWRQQKTLPIDHYYQQQQLRDTALKFNLAVASMP